MPVEFLLSDTLEELLADDLRTFQWYLCLLRDNFDPFKKGKLEGADRMKTVDLMVDKYEEKAVDVTLEILQTMGQNNLAQELQKKHREFLRKKSGSSSASVPSLEAAATGPSASQPGPRGPEFFRIHRTSLEARLGVLHPILLHLQDQGVLTDVEREEVESEHTKTLKNHALLVTLANKGAKAQEIFYQVLKGENSFLVKDLEGEGA